MKTTFLLHGGGFKYENPNNDTFCARITRDLNDGDQVLFIGFARREEKKRQEIYERDRGFILAQTDKDIKVVNATYADLMSQAELSQAIFITGGETPELVRDIQKYPAFEKAIAGKTIAGSSAGACLFSEYYLTRTHLGVHEGLGTLPIRFTCHYGNPEYIEDEKALSPLKAYPDNLELIITRECEWVEKTIDL